MSFFSLCSAHSLVPSNPGFCLCLPWCALSLPLSCIQSPKIKKKIQTAANYLRLILLCCRTASVNIAAPVPVCRDELRGPQWNPLPQLPNYLKWRVIIRHHNQYCCSTTSRVAVFLAWMWLFMSPIFLVSTQVRTHTHACIWSLAGCHTPVLTGHSVQCFLFWTIQGSRMKLSYSMARETELLVRVATSHQTCERTLCVCVCVCVCVTHK